MPEVLTRQDRVRQIKKRIHILKPKPEKARKGLFFARLLQDGSIRTWGHIAEGGADLDSLKVRIVPDVIIGYVDEKKVARFKGVILDFLEIETFLRVDERFWRWPFKASGIAHGEYHRKVAEDWWRDEAPPIIADFLKDLKRDIYKAWDRRGEMDTRQAQSIINRKNLEIILKLKRAFKDETPTYLLNEPGARRAQLVAGPIHSWPNFPIAALVNIKFGYSTEKIKKIQEIVGTEIDGIYGKKTLEAVKKYQKRLTELGLYKGPEDGLWDAATETAHEEYTGVSEEEEAEKIDKETLKDIIQDVKLTCQFKKKKAIAAETGWPGMKDSEQRLYITVKTTPPGYEEKVNLEVGDAKYRPRYRPRPGTLKRASNTKWIYMPFTEPETEKHPVLVNEAIVARVEDEEKDRLKFLVVPVFQYLTQFKKTKQDYDRALDYVQWKYPVSTENLKLLRYNPYLKDAGRTLFKTKIAEFGKAGFASENVLASTIGHENVHGGQDEKIFRDEVEAEIQAYGWELKPKNMRMTGIDNDPGYIIETRQKLEEYKRRKAAREKREKERKKREKKR